MTVSKVCGLYFLAETTNLSMNPRPPEGNFETRNINRYSLIPFLLFHNFFGQYQDKNIFSTLVQLCIFQLL